MKYLPKITISFQLILILILINFSESSPISPSSNSINESSERSKNEISEQSPDSIETDSLPALSDKVAKVFTTLNLNQTNFGDEKSITFVDSNAADSIHPGYPLAAYGHGPPYGPGPDHGPGPIPPPPSPGYDYGINELLSNGGHGLKISGGSKDHIFSQLIRLLLGIPTFKLSLLQPLILGFSNTVAHLSHSAAGVTADVAQHLPAISNVKADVLRNLITSFGHVTGSVLYVLAQLISSASSAKINFAAHTLPHIFNSVGHATHGVASTVGSFAQGIADTIQLIVNGVIEAVHSKQNVVTRIIEGGHELKSGVIKGVLKIDDKPKHHQSPYGGYGPPTSSHRGKY